MNQMVPPPIARFSARDVEEVFSIVSDMTREKRPVPNGPKIFTWAEKFGRHLVQHAAIGYLTVVVLAGLTYYLRSETLLATTLAVLILMISCVFAYLLISIIPSIPIFRKLRKDPHSPFLDLVETSLTSDIKYLNRLETCNLDAIKYVLTYYRYERTAIEERGEALSGSVRKIGIFPAIAAVAILYDVISRLHFGEGVMNLLKLVPFLILAFHAMNLFAFGLLQKNDRVVALMQYVSS